MTRLLFAAFIAVSPLLADFQPINIPGSYGTDPSAINNNGQIVGTAYLVPGHPDGFLWSNGTFSLLDYPGAVATSAYGINDSGHIVGIAEDANGIGFGFEEYGGVYSPIVYPGALVTFATGINDNGQIVGWYIDNSGGHSFEKNGTTYSSFDFPGAACAATFAYGINNQGDIVGFCGEKVPYEFGFEKEGNLYQALNFLPFGINDSGQMVGVYINFLTGFSYGMLDDHGHFGSFFFPGYYPSQGGTVVTGINDQGEVVGYGAGREDDGGFLISTADFSPSAPPEQTPEPGSSSVVVLGIIFGISVYKKRSMGRQQK
jgi:probable HAF family extracellular repeat protein